MPTLKELAEIFDNPKYFVWDGKGEPIGYAGVYADFPNNELIAEEVQDLKPRGRILELGGARGFITKKLRDKGFDAYNIDISMYCAKTRATNAFIRGSVTHLPFKDQSFDIAFSVELLEHIPEENLDQVLKEVTRVARRGFHAIAYEELAHFHDDKTHVVKKPLSWWREKIKLFGGDFKVVDKGRDGRWPQIIGKAPMPSPKQGPEVGVCVGSFVNMILSDEKVTWVNIDILDLGNYARAYGYNFIRHDVRQGLPFQEGSVRYIYCSHFLEHLTPAEGEAFLRECFRVLKPGGLIRLSVPDLAKLTMKYLKGEMKDFDILNPEYGTIPTQAGKLWQLVWSGHQAAYDCPALTSVLEKVGFENPNQTSPFKSQDPTLQKKVYPEYPDHSLFIEARKPEAPARVYTPSRGKLKIALISTPLLLTPPRHYGGLERVVYDLGVELVRMGHEVTLFAPEGSRLEGGTVIPTGKAEEKVHVDWFQAEMDAYRVYKPYLKDFDIIHSHTWWHCSYLAKMEDPELKVCATHHGHLNFNAKPPGVDKMNLFAISRFMAEEYASILRTDVRWVYNGIDIGAYPYRAKHGNRLLYVGRFATYKQPDLALEVAKRLNMPVDLCGGTFVEDPNYIESLRKRCDGKKFRFYPDAPHQVKLRLMQRGKALIFPSRMCEPFGLVAVEAMACGCPVVALNDGAISEVVQDGLTGYVCDVYSAPRIEDGRITYDIKRDPVDAMCEAVGKIGLIRSRNCRRFVEENFTRRLMAERYENSYREILEGNEW